MKKLKIEDLRVSSFTTESKTVSPIGIDPFCCTGCDSGCGINPTASGCDSGGGETQNCW
ncbi:hypothetical protein [Longimicrobium sp.]|uniref:hypothetical protein n=1 Tax=Longimicrobium sp. TaxID=2029185 RepID=UPI002E31591F|nr:hypothetical protein [Longimicrobium sp.]HEX6038850.1 hypothetical protein [Longimicrobium sp.]